ncbi:hypothetical protein Rs2_02918 [Raphanus sativus]|nr:hypothetical protein Rs2_02918 [Raphanus sativus]
MEVLKLRWSGRDVFGGRVRVSFDSFDGCSPKLRRICIDPESRDFQYSRWEWVLVVMVVSRLNPEFTCLDVQRRASFENEIDGSCLRRSFGLRFQRRFSVGGDGGSACGNTRLFGGRFRHVEAVSVMCGSRFSLELGFC